MDPSTTQPGTNGGRFRADPAAPVSGGAPSPDGAPSPADAFAAAKGRAAELLEYGRHYLSATADAYKSSLRNVILYAVLGALAAVAGTAVVVTASVYLLAGLAGAIGALCGGRWWVGQLVVGLLVLGGLVAGALVLVKKLSGASRMKTVQKYETRRHKQRVRFGRDVHTAARAGE